MVLLVMMADNVAVLSRSRAIRRHSRRSISLRQQKIMTYAQEYYQFLAPATNTLRPIIIDSITDGFTGKKYFWGQPVQIYMAYKVANGNIWMDAYREKGTNMILRYEWQSDRWTYYPIPNTNSYRQNNQKMVDDAETHLWIMNWETHLWQLDIQTRSRNHFLRPCQWPANNGRSRAWVNWEKPASKACAASTK